MKIWKRKPWDPAEMRPGDRRAAEEMLIASYGECPLCRGRLGRHLKFHLAAARPATEPARHEELERAIRDGDWERAAGFQDLNWTEDCLVYDVFQCPSRDRLVLARLVTIGDLWPDDYVLNAETPEGESADRLRALADGKWEPAVPARTGAIAIEGRIVLRPRRWPMVLGLLCACAGALLGLVMFYSGDRFFGGLIFGLCAIGTLAQFATIVVPDFGRLAIDDDGFAIRWFLDDRRYRWEDVEPFRIANPHGKPAAIEFRERGRARPHGGPLQPGKRRWIPDRYRVRGYDLLDLLNARRDAALERAAPRPTDEP